MYMEVYNCILWNAGTVLCSTEKLLYYLFLLYDVHSLLRYVQTLLCYVHTLLRCVQTLLCYVHT